MACRELLELRYYLQVSIQHSSDKPKEYNGIPRVGMASESYEPGLLFSNAAAGVLKHYHPSKLEGISFSSVPAYKITLGIPFRPQPTTLATILQRSPTSPLARKDGGRHHPALNCVDGGTSCSLFRSTDRTTRCVWLSFCSSSPSLNHASQWPRAKRPRRRHCQLLLGLIWASHTGASDTAWTLAHFPHFLPDADPSRKLKKIR